MSLVQNFLVQIVYQQCAFLSVIRIFFKDYRSVTNSNLLCHPNFQNSILDSKIDRPEAVSEPLDPKMFILHFVWLKFVSSTLFVSVDPFEVFWLKSFEIFPRSWGFEVETFSGSPRALEFQMKVLHSNQMANWIIWTIWIIRHVIPSC